MDRFRFTEIAEAGQPVLNPLAAEDLAHIGRLCRLSSGATLLDLGCGKGELLNTWAHAHSIRGLGVDIFQPFIDEAAQRAAVLGVTERVHFVCADAGAFDPGAERFDVVTCIGAAWVGGTLAETLDLMQARAVEEDPLLLVGEPFRAAQAARDGRLDLPGLTDFFHARGFDLVEMVIATREGWDRYMSRKWWTAERWLSTNAGSLEAPDVREHLDRGRRNYLHHDRHNTEWGVFFLRRRH